MRDKIKLILEDTYFGNVDRELLQTIVAPMNEKE
jgi:hypothetical protein